MSRGAAQEAQQQLALENKTSAQYGGQAAGIGSQLTPFLTGEMNAPTGIGQSAVNNMTTMGGQAVSSTLGSEKAAAQARAERSGNASGSGMVEDQATREALAQQSNNVLGIQGANQEEKMAQQQSGASGLSGLYGTDVSASLNAMGMGNGSIQAQNQADAQTLSAVMAPFQIAAQFVSAYRGNGGGGGGNGGGGGCWIAERIFGINDTRVFVLRDYLNRKGDKSMIERTLVKLYSKYGSRVAKSKILVAMLKPLFERVLVQAWAWHHKTQLQAWKARWVN